MSNQYEFLSDSDDNIDNESTSKLNPSKQGHKESKKSYASVATPKSSNDRNPRGSCPPCVLLGGARGAKVLFKYKEYYVTASFQGAFSQ